MGHSWKKTKHLRISTRATDFTHTKVAIDTKYCLVLLWWSNSPRRESWVWAGLWSLRGGAHGTSGGVWSQSGWNQERKQRGEVSRVAQVCKPQWGTGQWGQQDSLAPAPAPTSLWVLSGPADSLLSIHTSIFEGLVLDCDTKGWTSHPSFATLDHWDEDGQEDDGSKHRNGEQCLVLF